MRKTVLSLMCAAMFWACSQNEKTSQTSDTSQTDDVKVALRVGGRGDVAEYGLPLDSALRFIERYNQYFQSGNMTIPVSKAFTIRSVALLQAMGLPKSTETQYANVRAYIGLDYGNNFRLLITPVDSVDYALDSAGIDVVYDGFFTRGSEKDGLPVDSGRFVLDFTHPCPNFCDLSPLSHR